ncbi:MAG: cupredoxin domain-containing protein [Candidatus Dormibacteraeota bacterium]|nr:cupredoxin domain-containing protein [Candidatus Dormibacteraeota bacterium]
MIVGAAMAAAILHAIIGIAHVDREALAFAVLFALAAGILVRARHGARLSLATTILLGLLFADVTFWMGTATWSNIRNHEQLLFIAEPLALFCVSAAGLIGVAGRFLDPVDRAARPGTAVVTVAALATFVVGLGAATLAGWGREQAQGAGDLALQMRNTAYSVTTLTGTSRPMTLYVTNDDLFWHTVTIDHLGVDLKVPVGSHRRITIAASPGTYTYYCRIPGHAQAGMKGLLTIP